MLKKLYIFILIVISLISLAPFYMMLMMSTQYNEDIFKGMVLLPGNYFIQNFATVMKSKFYLYYLNSIYVSLFSTVLCLFISSLTGYALSKYEFKLKKPIYYFIIMTMMVPSQIGLIGYVVEMRAMHINNTLLPLIIIWTTNAFGVFWMTQYISQAVHSELIESARMDGCNDFGIFIKIVLPCIKPAIATLSMVIFLWSWNNYLLPLVIVSNSGLFTIPLGISSLGGYYRTDYAARMTGLAFSTIPLIIIFISGSKYFVRGLTAGAVKG